MCGFLFDTSRNLYLSHAEVSKVKDKAASRESSLQTRILELEAEKSRRENELKHMKQSKQSVSTRHNHIQCLQKEFTSLDFFHIVLRYRQI